MKRNRFITGYSGLRALAVVAVILYHFSPNYYVGGYLGVPIFFSLTGYLVTDHMIRSYHEQGHYNLWRFYRKRLVRLYPQIVTVLWLSASYILLFQRNLLAKLWQIVLANLLSVYNFWQIINGQSYFERFASNESPFTHLWTMSIDGQFYLLWPLILLLLFRFLKQKKYLFWTILGLSLLSALEMALLYSPQININRLYYGTDTRFFALGLGSALAVIWPIEKLRTHLAKNDMYLLDGLGLVSILGMLGLFFAPQMDPQGAFTYRGGMLLFSLFTTLLIAVIAHPGSHWNAWLTNPVFNWIGARSYAIYLYQFPVMIFFESKFTHLGDHVHLYHVVELLLILLLSELSYRVIEQPFTKFNFTAFKQAVVAAVQRTGSYLGKIKLLAAGLLVLLGTVALLLSPFIRAENFSHSQLAERIAANRKSVDLSNRRLIDRMKTARAKANAQSQSAHKERAHRSRRHARRNPINRDYMKYGLNTKELKLARRVNVLALGDSVMASSSNDIKRLMPHAIIDAAVARQANLAQGLFKDYQRQGLLAANVVIGLGTNGPFNMAEVGQLMQLFGPKRQVFWINTYVPSREWQGQVNQLLAQAARKYHNLTIIDWYALARAHPDWLYADNTHPNPIGAKHYSAFVVKQIVSHANY